AYFENDRLVRYNADSGGYEPFASDAEAREHLRADIQPWSAAPKGGGIGGGGLVIDNYDSRKTGSILTRKALQFIDRALATNDSPGYPEPFFLYFAPPQMHTPYTPPEFFNPAHDRDDEPAPDGIALATGPEGLKHQALISEIDLMLGALVDKLEQTGQLNNTLIVFSSDNGPTIHGKEADRAPQGRDNDLALRGYKGEIYEAGHRVPLIARWGDGTSASPVQPGRVSGELLGLHDLAATFYALLGLPRPAGQANDSKSLLPELTGERPDNKPLREQLIVQGSPASAADNAYRIDRALYQRGPAGDLWKLTVVSSLNDPLADIEWRDLYNLTVDPAEQNDRRNDPAVSAWRNEMRATYLDLAARDRTITRFR
ncbi:MAG: sulfatase-like hydrolase/transferase, partial [Gammaproteobacteria bacterium]|nr:sulfatase-like hydrolase/transferase [Gammaproteobacteria bacterium]